MIGYSVENYLNLIPAQHRNQPRYSATVSESITPAVTMQDIGVSTLQTINIETSRGVQLDWIGLWVGVSRRIPLPISDVYFSWQVSIPTGWDAGIWRGEHSAGTALHDLPDDYYRRIIKAKIQANIRRRTTDDIYAIFDAAFPSKVITITDNLDMSMVLNYTISDFDAFGIALIENDLIPVKIAGVGITYNGV